MYDHVFQRFVSRRRFLQGLAATSLLSTLAACGVDSEDSAAQSNVSVIIIGAGMAGLAAAQQLKGRVANLEILEARARVGGRIWTDRSLGVPVDLGAGWIHGPTGNPLSALAQAAGATTFRTADENVVVYDQHGVEIPEAELDAAYERYLELLEAAAEAAEPGQSLAAVIADLDPQALEDPLMLYQLSAYTEFDAGGAIAQLSASEWAEDEAFAGADVILPNGYAALVEQLAQDLPIRLEHVVQRIKISASGVIVETNHGSFTADYCICSLPLGILKAGDVQFEPPLPIAFQEAIDNLGLGHVNKIALHFPQTFWDADTQYIGYTAPVKGRYPYFLNANTFVPNANLLISVALGEYGLAMQNQSDAEIAQTITEILQTIYGNAAVAPQELLVSRWTNDPYSKGSYSFAATTTARTHFTQFEQSIQDRLFWAGEHTHVDYRATVHGAYLSGIRAAEGVLKQAI